jgi:hypothetical protein
MSTIIIENPNGQNCSGDLYTIRLVMGFAFSLPFPAFIKFKSPRPPKHEISEPEPFLADYLDCVFGSEIKKAAELLGLKNKDLLGDGNDY